MSAAKPWQIALIVIGLLAGIVGVVFAVTSSDRPNMASSMMLVDIETGQLYSVSVDDRSVYTPMKHPDTGERTLYRVVESESGDWSISQRRLGELEDYEGTAAAVDRESGRVTVLDADPIRIAR
ncbi:MAG: hypothetical protein ACTS22_04275 [Phycisphaerales bacterium]